jgi:hypothetical protein
MNKSILVSLAILTLSTSVALAAQRTHHSQAKKPNASATAMNPNPSSPTNPSPFGGAGTSPFGGVGTSPVGRPGAASNNDHEMYLRNKRESGVE